MARLRCAIAFLLASTAMAASPEGGAGNFLVLRSGADEVVLIDRDSISRKGSRAEAKVIERKEGPGGAGSERRSLYVFDCAAGTLAISERGGQLAEAALAPPRSGLEQLLLAYACGR